MSYFAGLAGSIRWFAALGVLLVSESIAAPWSVVPVGSIAIDPAGQAGVAELGGVAYQGIVPGGKHRFLAVADSGGRLITLEVGLSVAGLPTSAQAVASLALSETRDFEGAALPPGAPGSIFLSEEDTPAVLSYELATGAALGAATTPAPLTTRRANRGFESLAIARSGDVLWTASEDALTVDGPAATPSAGAVARLVRYGLAGGAATPNEQYAYPLDAVHAGSFLTPQAGLVELVSMPDGALLGLERSFAALASPTYRHRIYNINLTGATDISKPPYDAGLVGATYAAANKELLWSGSILDAVGQNLEGLTVGPQLATGQWVLTGVVDGGDPISGDLLVTFLATPPTPGMPGDYNGDGAVAPSDLDAWRSSFGLASPAGLGADGNGDGTIDAADYTLWRDNLSASLPSVATPEPGAAVLAALALGPLAAWGGTPHSKSSSP